MGADISFVCGLLRLLLLFARSCIGGDQVFAVLL